MSSIALNTSALTEALSARIAGGQQVSEVFLVACGGSLVDLYGSRFFLATETRRLRADAYSSNEFVHATPRALGEHSVVILCTHSGGTPEAVEAAKIAKSAGAFIATLTHNEDAKISAFADFNVVYEWGDESRVSDNPMAIGLSICLEVLQQSEGYAAYDDLRTGLERIDGIVAAAQEKVRERASAFAKSHRDESVFYVLSSGASFGHAHGFAACSLMEMQRLNASAIHSGEFFHGPFEITDEDTNFVVLLNEGRTRPLERRVIDFLERYSKGYEIVDARELGLDELPSSVVDYFNPILFYSVLSVYREALAKVRNHPLDTRRYMGKVDY